MEKKLYRISLDGCDASFDTEMYLDENGVKVLEELSDKTSSAKGCEPTMSVKKVEE